MLPETYTNLGRAPQEPTLYPQWKAGLIRSVEQALCTAWDNVVDKHPDALATKDEDKITDVLLEELTHLRRKGAGSFTAAIFCVPSRDAKLPDCHGLSIDQMPDITIRLVMPRPNVADDRHDALFFECKVLDSTRNLDSYRVDGINRFLLGRYAWRMPHAGMLAYTFKRRDDTPTKALTAYAHRSHCKQLLSKHMRMIGDPEEVCGATPPRASEIAVTKHDRLAPVVDGKTSEIMLRHIWFK